MVCTIGAVCNYIGYLIIRQNIIRVIYIISFLNVEIRRFICNTSANYNIRRAGNACCFNITGIGWKSSIIINLYMMIIRCYVNESGVKVSRHSYYGCSEVILSKRQAVNIGYICSGKVLIKLGMHIPAGKKIFTHFAIIVKGNSYRYAFLVINYDIDSALIRPVNRTVKFNRICSVSNI